MPPAALAIGSLAAGVGGELLKGDGTQTSQRSVDPFQAQLLQNGRGRLDQATQDLQRASLDAAGRADRGIRSLEAGQLDAGSKSLISQNVDRNRRLQSARKASLASQFGAGSQLSKILGSQQGLQSDLALNRQSFDAFRDQIDRQGAIRQGLGQSLGFRQAGVGGLLQSQQSQQATAGLTAGQTATNPRTPGDVLGGIGTVFGKVGQGFSSPNRSTR